MTSAKLKLAFGISAVIMLASGATTVALSSDAVGDNLSPNEIFKKARENYASLTSYSDEGKIVTTMNGTIITTAFTIRLARTNFYYIEWEQYSEPPDSAESPFFQAGWSAGAGNFLEMGNGPPNEKSQDIALAKAAEISGGAAGTIPRTFFNLEWGNQLGGSGLEKDGKPTSKREV
jgi:hypothetical protein